MHHVDDLRSALIVSQSMKKKWFCLCEFETRQENIIKTHSIEFNNLFVYLCPQTNDPHQMKNKKKNTTSNSVACVVDFGEHEG